MGIEVEGEQWTDLRFADDVALCTRHKAILESHFNTLSNESMKIGLRIHKGKTKYMTNYDCPGDIQIEGNTIEEVSEYKYLGQIVSTNEGLDIELAARIRAAWSCFGRH